MKYYVTYKIDARYTTEVEADNFKDALNNAVNNFVDADFGEAEDIEAEPIIVENENTIVWEKF